ncbi:hypothetical protein FGG79_19005 [Bacillus sp. BHET2]|uniref:type II toxin-antitoxin system RnlA family toxin n=1 Tax=Bacillus sp. BHET2 TaxID=2583818 RepID=UPI00110D9C0D|nr:type II toxin-antitoxin system RnlA family toxin [Bacillus sp. BHET2]TMU83786.1 hypothetical protein FGG79_19005 [Bacillus sp. BHET2]
MSKKTNPFKGLLLDRDRLLDWIQEYAEEKFESFEISPITLVGGVQHRCIIQADSKIMLLDFYFNNDDKTTIRPTVGQNQDVSVEIATHILGKLTYKHTDVISRSYSVHPIDEEELKMILQFFDEELEGVKKINQSYNESNNYTLYQYKSNIGDKLTLKYFGNKRLQIQGKPMFLYQEITCLLSGYFPFDEVIKNQSEFFSVEISPEEIREEMQELMPSAYNFLGENQKKILSGSLALNKIDIPLEDYSPFAFPALKTLEGVLKSIFLSKGVRIKKDGFGDYFGYNGVLRKQELLVDKLDIDGSVVVKKVIEDLYNYYNKHRHKLFHVEAIDAATRIIETKQEAETIVSDVLSLIEIAHKELNGVASRR